MFLDSFLSVIYQMSLNETAAIPPISLPPPAASFLSSPSVESELQQVEGSSSVSIPISPSVVAGLTPREVEQFMQQCDDYRVNGPPLLLSPVVRSLDGSVIRSSPAQQAVAAVASSSFIRGRLGLVVISAEVDPISRRSYTVWRMILNNGEKVEWSHPINQPPPGGFHRYEGDIKDMEQQTGITIAGTHGEKFLAKEVKDGCCSSRFLIPTVFTLTTLLVLCVVLIIVLATIH